MTLEFLHGLIADGHGDRKLADILPVLWARHEWLAAGAEDSQAEHAGAVSLIDRDGSEMTVHDAFRATFAAVDGDKGPTL